jgi:hypothetical protein
VDDDDAGEVFDCAGASPTPLSERTLDGARGYHGLAIDTDGFIVGADGQGLIKSDYVGNWQVFLPGLGSFEQMEYLADGDLIANASDNGSILRITPQGGYSTLLPDRWAYGMRIGPDGMAYAAGNGLLTRTDPATGASETLATWNQGEPHALDFAKDFSALYVSMVGPRILWKIDLDDDMDPIGGPQAFATGLGEGWMDGVAVDACGYIYVPEFWSRTLYRVAPNGTHQVYLSWSNAQAQYGHGVVWGNGVGGWREDALYLPMPYGSSRVKEIVVGVPSRMWEGTVINAPLP